MTAVPKPRIRVPAGSRRTAAVLRLVAPDEIEPNADAVTMLESAIERTRSGEFEAVGICAASMNGEITTAYSVGERHASLITACRVLDDRIVEAFRCEE